MEAVRITPEGVDFGLVYFTSNSLLADDRRIILIQKHNNCRNLFLMDVATGETKKITNHSGLGNHSAGNDFYDNDFDDIIDGSVIVHAETGRIYYMLGRKICRTDLNGDFRVLANLPESMGTGCMHVSQDGKKLLLSTCDMRGYKDYDGTNNPVIDYTFQSLGLSSQIRVFDTETGEQIVVSENIQRAWVTHVQFSPQDDHVIMYNHEWPADCGIRRIWIWNGSEHVLVRPEGDGRSRDDWTCHEMWERSGTNLVYHGGYKNGIYYIGKAVIPDLYRPRDIGLDEIAFPQEYVKYGHFTVSNTRALVTDGYYQAQDEPSGPSRWITILKPDWEKKTIEWIPLCRHGSNWKGQESHPHPIFNHAANAVYFNSNKEGYRAVYKVDVSSLDLT